VTGNVAAFNPRRYIPPGWVDPILAVVFLLACEVETLIDLDGDRSRHHWPLAGNVLIIAGVAVPIAWRRRAPLACASVVMVCVFVLTVSLNDVKNVTTPQLALFIIPYSVAAYSSRTRAILGLAICVAAIAAANLLEPGLSSASSWVFSLGASTVPSWVTGRLLRARRTLAAELRRTNERIIAEQHGREMLALAEQRTRIARELQTLVANSVSAMIVQTQAAQRLLAEVPADADRAMAVIEDTGRQALAEMRRILGVLRHPDERPDLSPAPGVGQIPMLVERVRRDQRRITLQVEGDPGPLPASVDLGVYRILEDALSSADDSDGPIDVMLQFGADDVELAVTSYGGARLDWPTIAIRERVALCQGVVDVDIVPDGGERLVVQLPRVFEGAFA
jgi:signal transduction histidine kinase